MSLPRPLQLLNFAYLSSVLFRPELLFFHDPEFEFGPLSVHLVYCLRIPREHRSERVYLLLQRLVVSFFRE